jgi:hypothetical protein
VAVAVCAVISATGPAVAQVQMPNPKDMSGSILPSPDIPVGTVTARVLRGNFDKPIAGQVVEFIVDGKSHQTKTDADGRAMVDGLRRGASVRAVATVDGERLESKEVAIADSGLRILLVATDPEMEKRAAEDKALAAAAAVKGVVVLGPESRIIAEIQNDELAVFYQFQILNSARTPVDPGGPLIFDLPSGARGASVIEGSTPQATANGPRITVTGPFAPGVTQVEAAYTLPNSSGTAVIELRMPAALEQLNVVVQQLGGFSVRSSQLSATREVAGDQGQPMIIGTGPSVPAGQSVAIEISGLPHRPAWPRNLALALVALIIVAGAWSAITAPARRVSA